MFDDLHFEDYVENIPEIQNDNLISISPNPASDELSVHRAIFGDRQKVQVLNHTGQVLFANPNFIGEKIDTRRLPSGIYLLIYSNTQYYTVKKFVVQH